MIQSWLVFPLNYFLEKVPSLFAEMELYFVTALFYAASVVTNALPHKNESSKDDCFTISNDKNKCSEF